MTNKNCNTHKDLNLVDIIEYYNECKSIRKTAKHFSIDKATLRKHYITDEFLIRKIKQTKQERKNSIKYNVTEWRKQQKIKLVEYKGGKCERCGYCKCIQALQFHHVNPDEKDFQISGKSYSFERMKKEVDKCKLLCANCHIEIHNE